MFLLHGWVLPVPLVASECWTLESSGVLETRLVQRLLRQDVFLVTQDVRQQEESNRLQSRTSHHINLCVVAYYGITSSLRNGDQRHIYQCIQSGVQSHARAAQFPFLQVTMELALPVTYGGRSQVNYHYPSLEPTLTVLSYRFRLAVVHV
jgi:hypothetical protein